jgi:hypothetical protein
MFPYTRVANRNKRSEMTEQLILETTPLNAVDRCDRCGAQAYVRAVLLNGGELLFCGHHAKEYAEKLKPVVKVIQDETDKLTAVSSDSN